MASGKRHDDHRRKIEGPAIENHVIARSRQATWQSRGPRNIPENRRDCHGPVGPRNDVVIGDWSFCCYSGNWGRLVGVGSAARPTE